MLMQLFVLCLLLLLTMSAQTAKQSDEAPVTNTEAASEAKNKETKNEETENEETKNDETKNNENNDKASDEQFIPTEAISEDLSVMFPVDI